AWAASDSGPRSAREWLRTIAGPRSIRPFATAFEIAPALVQPEPFRVLNPDSTVWPEQRDGYLTLTTNFGDIQFDPTYCPNDRQPRNILWIPVEKPGAFMVTAVIDSFWPTLNYQQAGIVVANGEEFTEFVELTVGSLDGLLTVKAIHQVRQEPRFSSFILGNAHADPLKDRELRIVRDGAAWRCETRRVLDAGWDTVSQAEVVSFDFEPKLVGIFAMHSFACEGERPNRLPVVVPPTDVRFSSFAMEPYPALP
ncbi:hypothetical protein K8I85_08935, partial [bacterium]|nr:hypothetical protein [bacterium]